VRWRRQRPLEVALSVLFGVAAVVALARAAALGARLRALDDDTAAEFARRARDADSLVRATDVAFGLVSVVIAACFIVWCWRAAKNQQALGRAPERLGSGWAIGGWFVPLANLVIPVLVIQDLWRGSDARIERGDPRWRIADRSWLVGWWWGLLLSALFISAGTPAEGQRFDAGPARATNLLAIFGMVSAAAAAVLAILVVRRLGARQEACRAVQLASSPVATADATAGATPSAGAGLPHIG